MTDPDPEPSAPPGDSPSPTTPVTAPAALDVLGPATRPLVVIATFVLVLLAVLGMREVAGVVVPILFGLLLALVAAPLRGAFQRRGMSQRMALVATVGTVLSVIVIVVVLIAFSIAEFVAQLPQYEDELADALDAFRTTLANAGLPVSPDAISSIVSPSALAGFIRPVASSLGSALLDIFIALLTLVYAIVGAASLRRRAESAFGEDHALIGGVERFGVDLRRYLIVRAELGLFAGVLVLVMLFVLGVPFPLLWAFLTFAASFIPNVGFIIALIPPTILAFLGGGLVPAAIVVIGFTVINLFQDNLLQPIVLGSELNLSPLVVFVAVIAWAWILGGAGALLAVPLTVALLTLLEASPWTRGVALLMRQKENLARPRVATIRAPWRLLCSPDDRPSDHLPAETHPRGAYLAQTIAQAIIRRPRLARSVLPLPRRSPKRSPAGRSVPPRRLLRPDDRPSDHLPAEALPPGRLPRPNDRPSDHSTPQARPQRPSPAQTIAQAITCRPRLTPGRLPRPNDRPSDHLPAEACPHGDFSAQTIAQAITCRPRLTPGRLPCPSDHPPAELHPHEARST